MANTLIRKCCTWFPPRRTGVTTYILCKIFMRVPEVIVMESNTGSLKLNLCYRFNLRKSLGKKLRTVKLTVMSILSIEDSTVAARRLWTIDVLAGTYIS